MAMLNPIAAMQMQDAADAPTSNSSADADRKAAIDKSRSAALRDAGMSVSEFKAGLKELRKLVPRLREERLLQLQPAVLRNLLSEGGINTAAARLVQLQLLDTRQSVLDKVRQRPELLEQSFLMGHTSTPKALVFTQQGHVLVSLDDGGALLVWDMQGHRTCTAVPPASPDDCLHTVVAHPDGRHVLVGGTRPERLTGRISDSMEPLLCLLDAQTQRWVAELRSDLLGAPAVRNRLYWTEVTCLAISADGQYAVAGDAWGTLTAWDLLKRQHVATVEQAHSGVVCTLAFSPDLRQLVSGGQDHLLRLWDWDDVLAGKARG